MTYAQERRARLRAEVASAARLVAPLWPLNRWVAVNPLVGLVDLGFEGAIEEAQRWLPLRGYPDRQVLHRSLAEGLVEHVDLDAVATDDVKTADLLVAPGPAKRPEPPDLSAADLEVTRLLPTLLAEQHGGDESIGAYERWACRTGSEPAWLRRRSEAHRWPLRADDTVLAALDRLEVPPQAWSGALRARLARLPGWAGYARWCDEWATDDDTSPRLGLTELLALQLRFEVTHPDPTGSSEALGPMDTATRPRGETEGAVILAALEHGHRRRLLEAVGRRAAPAGSSPADAQVVFCIDARSEGLRRHLEAAGRYETLGFAGFFATPMHYRPLGSTVTVPSAPVLVRPEVEVAEAPTSDQVAEAARYVRLQRSHTTTIDVATHLAHGPVTMFPAAEAAGWALGPAALVRSLRPRHRARRARPRTELRVEAEGDLGGFTTQEMVLVAETALRTMGLTDRFAPLVVLCGHGSTSTANPHAAALDCGACGGSNGGPNGRALAAILNRHEVRAALARSGIVVPDTTWFLGAQHDTTLDSVALLDRHLAPAHQSERLRMLEAALDRAGDANAEERIRRLPDATGRGAGRREVGRRAGDWAQTRPEWGLVRNAAFIVAPRTLTEGIDLDGRAFLHSYDPDGDLDGAALETILTAPMVVAQWINAQYYFSSVDPETFGAGDKTLHNPVAGIGVLQGGDGDLCVGLPWQSVADGHQLRHVPIRLLTLVQAPRPRVDAVIARNPLLSDLFDGGWVQLIAGEGPQDWKRWHQAGWTEPIDLSHHQESSDA